MTNEARGRIRLLTLLMSLAVAAAVAVAAWLALGRARQLPLAAEIPAVDAQPSAAPAEPGSSDQASRSPASDDGRNRAAPRKRSARPRSKKSVSASPPRVHYTMKKPPEGTPPLATPLSANIPSFPWPPPKPSGMRDVPIDWLVDDRATAHLSDLDARLSAALDQLGYAQRTYYGVPAGFALMTRVERIQPDGRPVQGPDRWAIDDSRVQILSLVDYLKALFLARPGRFRVLVFTVTPQDYVPSGLAMTVADAERLLLGGFPRLPDAIGSIALASAPFHCTALVYEFERAAETDPARTVVPGHLDVGDHLVRSGVWGAIAP